MNAKYNYFIDENNVNFTEIFARNSYNLDVL